ncbi:tyrosine-type recombinase/integrase [Methylobacterium oxalidis]|uniref:Tyr recombinase domain-containing protein n=1 Tax=Methylobacterium oxalidis TaxID=944322 RepID=A0A512J1B6_9HYPH|nr:tyrosine-type recombinase/integrase [Methylobacterium oxalidis]GEP03703.1 hypothetical protein MOX02_17410 [Methylobacterium oxalidis]GJE33691.1 Tyrosine recombinase XerC [Methylobacterium oxalidis]GLS62287.1 hypothetical protein GCM10007888_06680 [Methylobacterium oxalidis]
MILSMKRHASRADSELPQFKRRVPTDVAERLKGRVVSFTLPAVGREDEIPVSFRLGEFAKVSLRTRHSDVAKVRALALAAHLQGVYEAVRQGPAVLSQMQMDALAGEVYRQLVAEHDENPGTVEQWERFKALTRAAVEGRIPGAPPIPADGRSDDAVMADLLFGDATGEELTARVDALPPEHDGQALVQRVGRLAFWALDRRGVVMSTDQELDLLRRVARAALDAAATLKKRAGGDWRPDPVAERFPSYEARQKGAGVTLSELFEKWRAERKPAPSSVSTWRGVINSLARHLKHEDAARITRRDILAWKDAEIARGLDATAFGDGPLAAVKAILNFAVRNDLLKENPAQGIVVSGKKKPGTSMLPYEDEEVARLLAITAHQKAPARRWLPLLAALTGARIGELAALWGSSVIEREGVIGIMITPSPDGATLKNVGSERFVPLHPAIIEAGFVTFARERGHRPLFYLRPAKRVGEGKHPSKGVTNHLATWIGAQGFKRERVAPLHGLRHWWKSAASRVGAPDSIADAIQGHTDKGAAARYRHISIAQMAEAVAMVPLPATPHTHGSEHELIPIVRAEPG